MSAELLNLLKKRGFFSFLILHRNHNLLPNVALLPPNHSFVIVPNGTIKFACFCKHCTERFRVIFNDLINSKSQKVGRYNFFFQMLFSCLFAAQICTNKFKAVKFYLFFFRKKLLGHQVQHGDAALNRINFFNKNISIKFVFRLIYCLVYFMIYVEIYSYYC